MEYTCHERLIRDTFVSGFSLDVFKIAVGRQPFVDKGTNIFFSIAKISIFAQNGWDKLSPVRLKVCTNRDAQSKTWLVVAPMPHWQTASDNV